MTLAQYEMLMAVVDNGSFTKAAEGLGCTQSAVSHGIDALEKELGLTLSPRQRQAVRSAVEEGVLILASGGLVHNLRRLAWDGEPDPEPWATAFEAWMMTGIEGKDLARLLGAPDHAPGYDQAAPTSEHLDPLYFALGAADPDAPSTLFEN